MVAEMDHEHAERLRDRKKLATRRALRHAALELVAARGFSNVTVEDIAAAADVSPRTFFNYFPSKEAALLADDPELLVELRSAMRSRPADEAVLDVVRSVMKSKLAESAHLLDEGSDPLETLRRMKAVLADPHLRAVFVAHMGTIERCIAEGIAERLGTDLAEDPYPSLVAVSSTSALRLAFALWARSGGRARFASLVDAAFAALRSGLADDGGLAAILRQVAGTAPGAGSGAGRVGESGAGRAGEEVSAQEGSAE